ncbi:5-methylaminomethyl-2-thiouridylate-methyltransferase, partial [Suhomyces tanzawaensis NRRL Y-17324]
MSRSLLTKVRWTPWITSRVLPVSLALSIHKFKFTTNPYSTTSASSSNSSPAAISVDDILSNKLPVNELPPRYIQAEPSPDDEIIIAMSSGVDSSVAAALYAKKYRNVRGIYMANWSQTAKCTESDWNDVQKVCKSLNIPCERVNFEKEYWSEVFQPMIQMYEQGLTPNPDTGCNKYVKFGKMIEHLSEKFRNQDKKWWLVTGHYARIMKDQSTGEFHLLRGYSQGKDQSYYLSSIPSDILARVLMPIGHHLKPAVRQMAHDLNLHVSNKPDSQGLCFVSQDQKNFREFLNEYIEPNPGNIVTEDGRVWGKHQGLWHCTIGQKSTVSMPQGDPNYKGVWFVSEKNVERNELVIVKGGNNPKLFNSKIMVKDWEWLSRPFAFNEDNEILLQYRSLQTPLKVKQITSNSTKSLVVELEESARAMAPGQNVVLYKHNQVLGSGIIARTLL